MHYRATLQCTVHTIYIGKLIRIGGRVCLCADKWYGIMYTQSKSTNPTNKLILSMTINQYIFSNPAHTHVRTNTQIEHTRIHSHTFESMERTYTNDVCLKKFLKYMTLWVKSGPNCLSWIENNSFGTHFVDKTISNFALFGFICVGWLVDCDVLIKTTGWISKLLKLFTSLKLKLNQNN